MGWWQTESTKEAAKITSGEFAGQANRPIFAARTLLAMWKRTLASLGRAGRGLGVKVMTWLRLPSRAWKGCMLQRTRNRHGFGAPVCGLYKGMPYDLSTDIYLPKRRLQSWARAT